MWPSVLPLPLFWHMPLHSWALVNDKVKNLSCACALFLEGYDVIAQAQSGTGKTATFAISILQQLEIEQKETQALVLAPTRELAQQVCCS